MSEPVTRNGVVVEPARQSPALPIAVAFAILAAIGALVWAFMLQQRLNDADAKLTAAEQGSSAFSRRLAEADAKIRANSDAVGEQLDATQKTQEALQARATALASQASAQRNETSRLAKTQQATAQQLGEVKTNVSAVQTDVASTKTDVAATRSDLDSTKQLLSRTVGDAGVMSGLIARNHDELEVLKHKGDRNYYEFTLHKGQQPTLLSTVKLQLKKVNDKKSRYTMLVNSNDRNIEKKDKTMLEPVQFYSGKDPALFEIVVNNITKDGVSGYLSVPKGA